MWLEYMQVRILIQSVQALTGVICQKIKMIYVRHAQRSCNKNVWSGSSKILQGNVPGSYRENTRFLQGNLQGSCEEIYKLTQDSLGIMQGRILARIFHQGLDIFIAALGL